MAFEYWADGTLRSRTDQEGNTWTYEVDYPSEGGRIETETGPAGTGIVNESEYDPAGRLRFERTGTGTEVAETEYVYDVLGRIDHVMGPEFTPEGGGSARETTWYDYDANGNVVRTTTGPDGTDSDDEHSRVVEYDLRGRVGWECQPGLAPPCSFDLAPRGGRC